MFVDLDAKTAEITNLMGGLKIFRTNDSEIDFRNDSPQGNINRVTGAMWASSVSLNFRAELNCKPAKPLF